MSLTASVYTVQVALCVGMLLPSRTGLDRFGVELPLALTLLSSRIGVDEVSSSRHWPCSILLDRQTHSLRLCYRYANCGVSSPHHGREDSKFTTLTELKTIKYKKRLLYRLWRMRDWFYKHFKWPMAELNESCVKGAYLSLSVCQGACRVINFGYFQFQVNLLI